MSARPTRAQLEAQRDRMLQAQRNARISSPQWTERDKRREQRIADVIARLAALSPDTE